MPETDNPVLESEQRYRASAYALLAALLRAPPDQALLDHLATLSPADDSDLDDLGQAMAALATAGEGLEPGALEQEYNDLFIGLGRGEVVPYGSWYLTGFLMEQPLSELRDDLRMLGFERNEAVKEPEDHAAAIFEVFSVMISDAHSLTQQHQFFNKHMRPWLERFFGDLGKARSASFYRRVAQFGEAFIRLESAYLSMRN